MIGAISGYGSISYYNPYTQRGSQAQGAQRSAALLTTGRSAGPEVPVEPVSPVKSVTPQEAKPLNTGLPAIREGADPVEMAVRMRIQYADPAAEGAKAAGAALPGAGQNHAAEALLPGMGKDGAAEALLPGMGKDGAAEDLLPGMGKDESAEDLLPGMGKDEAAEEVPGEAGALGAEAVQEAAEEGKCETCEKRKYQDESDDPGVSFQTPTNVSPEQAASAVRGHEMEHVVREQAKAQREDRKVVSQSVSYHTAICPECGKPYVSGGTTRTVTAANNTQQETAQQQQENQNRTPFSAVA